MKVLVLPLGEEHYALPLESVQQIISEPRVTRMPISDPAILGLLNVRGDIVPLFDAAVLLGSGAHGAADFAILVGTSEGPAALGVGVMPDASEIDAEAGRGRRFGGATGLPRRRPPGHPARDRGPARRGPDGAATGELEDEFRPLFMEEARDRLERMTSGLLALEAEPANPSPIDGIFREAHTLKGGAGLVGLSQVSHLSHRLEDLLEELRVGSRQATPKLTDSLLKAVDGLGRLIAGSGSGVEDPAVVAAIEGALAAIDGAPAARR